MTNADVNRAIPPHLSWLSGAGVLTGLGSPIGFSLVCVGVWRFSLPPQLKAVLAVIPVLMIGRGMQLVLAGWQTVLRNRPLLRAEKQSLESRSPEEKQRDSQLLELTHTICAAPYSGVKSDPERSAAVEKLIKLCLEIPFLRAVTGPAAADFDELKSAFYWLVSSAIPEREGMGFVPVASFLY